MGGHKAAVNATSDPQPVVEPPKQKKAQGGFYGIGTVMPGTMLDTGTSRRGAILGG